jgi:site-specific DNA-methyltransferase (adenine-specific)
MQPPDTIPFSSINRSNRIRQDYNGIEELAEGIQTLGLIQPVVLIAREDGSFELSAGGRRCEALALLNTETLYHAHSCVPGKPGYILKGETGDPLMDLLTEIAENHDREDVPWQQELPAIVKAWKLVERDHHRRGEEITLRQFGSMLGVGYHDLQSAVKIWDAYVERPERFAACTTVRQAMALLLREGANEAAKAFSSEIASTAMLPGVRVHPGLQLKKGGDVPVITESPLNSLADVPSEGEAEPTTVPLSSMFNNCDSLAFMESMPDACVNHIITDPDYAISAEALGANSGSAHLGVAQADVTDSLSDLRRLIQSAFRVIDDHGFLVFFMDLEHWEKLRDYAGHVGWRVQRWPIIWRVTDRRSNAAPSHNFCKNFEPAMLCRKPGAILNEAQMSSIFEHPSAACVKQFAHPFAKPVQVWRWIYRAITVKGQKVYDPFLGSGSSACAAIEHGLQPLGTELSGDHYNNALFNIQLAYTKQLGEGTKFC